MKITKQNIAKYIRLYALVFWGLLSILYVVGEPIDEGMPFGAFCFLKLLGLVSLGLCCSLGRWLQKARMLPPVQDEIDREI